MKIDKHSENCIKAGIKSIFTEFPGLSSSITLNIITLLVSGKSVVVKNLPRNIIFYFSAFFGS